MNLVSELSGTIAASQPSMSYIGSQPNITSTKDAGDISLVSQPSTSIVQSQKQSQEVTCWRHWCRTSTKKILSEKKSSKSIQKGKNSGKISLASEPLKSNFRSEPKVTFSGSTFQASEIISVSSRKSKNGSQPNLTSTDASQPSQSNLTSASQEMSIVEPNKAVLSVSKINA